MTISSLVAVLIVGAVIGLGGRWLIPAARAVPVWVLLAVGVFAAAFGTIAARLIWVNSTRVGVVELVLQAVFAGLGVALVAATADRLPTRPPDRDDRRRRRGGQSPRRLR